MKQYEQDEDEVLKRKQQIEQLTSRMLALQKAVKIRLRHKISTTF